MIVIVIQTLNFLILSYFIILSFGYLTLLAASIPDIFRHFREINLGGDLLRDSEHLPGVTVIIPAYNEENSILDTVYSVIKNNYKNIQIIVVNDGSTDSTLKKLISTFDLHKIETILPEKIQTEKKLRGYYISKYHINLVVLDKKNGEKSDALNLGLNACRTPLFLTIDADSILSNNAINEIIYYMMTRPHVIAVGGAVYILNGCTYKNGEILEPRMPLKPITALQACEYLRSFLFCRTGWNFYGGSLSYAGAFTAFDYKSIIDIGGFDPHNVAQDFEIITHLHAYYLKNQIPYTIGFTPSATVWTDVPDTLSSFWKQRSYWQIGTLKSLMRHKNMLLNPKYGITGLLNYPFFLFGETLGPLVECFAYFLLIFSWYFGILDTYFAILFFIICWGFVTFITMATALMSFITYNRYKRLRDLLWLFLIVMAESFGFRQYQVFCRVIATFKYIFSS